MTHVSNILDNQSRLSKNTTAFEFSFLVMNGHFMLLGQKTNKQTIIWFSADRKTKKSAMFEYFFTSTTFIIIIMNRCIDYKH